MFRKSIRFLGRVSFSEHCRDSVLSSSRLAFRIHSIDEYLHRDCISSFRSVASDTSSRIYEQISNPVSFSSRWMNTSSSQNSVDDIDDTDVQIIEDWEEEDDAEPVIGDGGSGGGIVLQGVPWGEKVLSIAREVLLQYGNGLELFSFKTTPRGYIYVRLDKLSSKFGCPSMEEMESYNQEFKKRLDQMGGLGEIPDDLAIEVSTPGADRILRLPKDLNRFKDMPMRVCYVEHETSNVVEKSGVFLLESIVTDSEEYVWKLADVKENRDPLSKGRGLDRKRKEWRLRIPYANCKKGPRSEDLSTTNKGFEVVFGCMNLRKCLGAAP